MYLNTPLDYAKATVATMMRKNSTGDLEDKKNSFNYHMGVFLHGIYSNYQLCGEETWFDFVKDWVDSLVDEEGHIHGTFRVRLDDFQAGNMLYPLYERTGECKYKKALDFLMSLIDTYPKNKAGGFWHMERCPNQMWLDGLYMGGPLMCKYSAMFGDTKYMDEAAKQALLMRKMTEDKETGLWYHAFDSEKVMPWANPETGLSPEFWGRSIGWVPVAILEELDCIPKNHPDYENLCALVRDLLTAVCKYQSEDGRWYQVVNKVGQDGNWPENSCSCLFTAAICKAVRKGILDDNCLKQAKAGYYGVINSLHWDGDDILIGNVCIGTGVGDYKHYCDRPVCTNDLHGVGAFLIMCGEMARV